MLLNSCYFFLFRLFMQVLKILVFSIFKKLVIIRNNLKQIFFLYLFLIVFIEFLLLSNDLFFSPVVCTISYNFDLYSGTVRRTSSRNGGNISTLSSNSGMELRNLLKTFFFYVFCFYFTLYVLTFPHKYDLMLDWPLNVPLDLIQVTTLPNLMHHLRLH